MSDSDDRPLPEGWVREFDPKSQHPFWVDTKAKPPRSVWVHPYEDELFLRDHPDIRDRLRSNDVPPPYTPRRHSFSGTPSSSSHLTVPERNNGPSHSQPGTPVMDQSQSNRGFMGKLKDKAIGTKEEREARRKEEQRQEELYVAEQRRLRQQAADQASQQATQQRMLSPLQLPHHGGFGSYGGSYQPQYSQPVYAAPYGSPYGRTRRTGFGGGIGLPLLAGAAGGFVLGELLDGHGHHHHHHHHGGWGGGGWGGGPGFGGPGFGGPGFGGPGFGGPGFGGPGFGGPGFGGPGGGGFF